MKEYRAPVSIEDIMKNPRAFGAPTYEEFKRNPSKWRRRTDESMISLSEGPVNNRRALKKIKYFIHGVQLSGEDAVERALGDYGYTLEDINLEKRDSRLKKEINLVPVQGGLDHDIHVNFLP